MSRAPISWTAAATATPIERFRPSDQRACMHAGHLGGFRIEGDEQESSSEQHMHDADGKRDDDQPCGVAGADREHVAVQQMQGVRIGRRCAGQDQHGGR